MVRVEDNAFLFQHNKSGVVKSIYRLLCEHRIKKVKEKFYKMDIRPACFAWQNIEQLKDTISKNEDLRWMSTAEIRILLYE